MTIRTFIPQREALVVQPPMIRLPRHNETKPSIFLAGSIEMGAAEDWQAKAIAALKTKAAVIYNPRRDDWDSAWGQKIDSPQFNAQVHWELDMIERADLVLFHFEPNTKSPITLMELGIVAGKKPGAAMVSCPAGFWRRGNVEIVCERYNIPLHEDLDSLLAS